MKDKGGEAWKRRAVATCNVEISAESPSAVRVGYASVSKRLEAPRHLAAAGYQDQRREWIGIIADALGKGLPVPEADFLEIVAMLKRAAGGDDVAEAFGLKRSKGGKKDTERLNRLHGIAEVVFAFSKKGHPLSVESSKEVGAPDSAYIKADELLGIGVREAREAWVLFGESLRKFYGDGLWEEPLPTAKKLTRRKVDPRK